jgi:hypothetical protein
MTAHVVIDDKTYLAAVVFVGSHDACGLVEDQFGVLRQYRGADWAAWIYRPKGKPTSWTVKYRFRYYLSAAVFHRIDVKSWYELRLKGTEAEVTNILRKFANQLVAHQFGTKVEYLPVRGSGDAMHRLMAKGKVPWLHTK